MRATEGTEDVHPRGVFTGSFAAPGGDEILFAVNNAGEMIAQVVVTRPENRDAIIIQLETLLNLSDHHTKLSVVN